MKIESMSREITFFLGFIMLCGAIFFFQLKTTGSKYDNLTENGKHTKGTIERIYRGVEYSYLVGSKLYRNSVSSFPRGIVDGEVFLVYYAPNDPDESIIDFYQPVFDTLQYTGNCSLSFERVNGADRGLVHYQYRIGEDLYERYQRLVNTGQSQQQELEVLVKKSNPNIAYLSGEPCSE